MNVFDSPNRHLQYLVRMMLDPAASQDQLEQSLQALHDVLYTLADDGLGLWDQGDTPLSTGIAIGPAAAISCLHDTWRTVKFLRGIYRAIRDLQARFAKTKIHVVDAGCGPLATLVLPLCALGLFPNS